MPISLGIGTAITMGGGPAVGGSSYPSDALAWQGPADILVWSTATDFLTWS